VAGGTPVVPQLASQMTISGEDLNARPILRSTDILEAAPGLAVVQHSGSGKANQYYLRGYNLDHGTDLAIFWDGIPINLPTDAHGQGYADLNFLIPETVNGLEVRKGPYFADVGDFANAGDLHISLRDRVDQNIVSMTVGSFGYDRFLSLGSTRLGDGWLLYAGEFNTYDGPWVTAEDVRKFSGLLRYSQGTPTNGFSATAMAYTSNWNSPAGFPQAQIGNAPGNFIPEAPWMVASAGITFGEKTGWFSALGWRYISSRPLTEDGVFQSPPLNTINANVGYRFANGWRVQLDALNLLNSTS
jgi:hypothetical protein